MAQELSTPMRPQQVLLGFTVNLQREHRNEAGAYAPPDAEILWRKTDVRYSEERIGQSLAQLQGKHILSQIPAESQERATTEFAARSGRPPLWIGLELKGIARLACLSLAFILP
jgi:hypothetical protein